MDTNLRITRSKSSNVSSSGSCPGFTGAPSKYEPVCVCMCKRESARAHTHTHTHTRKRERESERARVCERVFACMITRESTHARAQQKLFMTIYRCFLVAVKTFFFLHQGLFLEEEEVSCRTQAPFSATNLCVCMCVYVSVSLSNTVFRHELGCFVHRD